MSFGPNNFKEMLMLCTCSMSNWCAKKIFVLLICKLLYQEYNALYDLHMKCIRSRSTPECMHSLFKDRQTLVGASVWRARL